jgi:hypothetical protein
MIIFEKFDYIYCRLYLYYAKYYVKYKGKTISAELSSVLLLSVLQAFNIFTLYALYLLIIGEGMTFFDIPRYNFLFLPLILNGINILRYLKAKKIKIFREKWGAETLEIKKKKGYGVVGYLVFSLIAFFGVLVPIRWLL